MFVRFFFAVLGVIAIVAGSMNIWKGLVSIEYRKLLKRDEANATAKIVKKGVVEDRYFGENGDFWMKEF